MSTKNAKCCGTVELTVSSEVRPGCTARLYHLEGMCATMGLFQKESAEAEMEKS